MFPLVVTVLTVLVFLDIFPPGQELCHWIVIVNICVSISNLDFNDGVDFCLVFGARKFPAKSEKTGKCFAYWRLYVSIIDYFYGKNYWTCLMFTYISLSLYIYILGVIRGFPAGLLAGEFLFWKEFKIDFALAQHRQDKNSHHHLCLKPRFLHLYSSETELYSRQ